MLAAVEPSPKRYQGASAPLRDRYAWPFDNAINLGHLKSESFALEHEVNHTKHNVLVLILIETTAALWQPGKTKVCPEFNEIPWYVF
jgi:hypothetical protein